MTTTGPHTLTKAERVAGYKLVDMLFSGGNSKAVTAFPLRMVYMRMPREKGQPAAKMMVSVPKRYFKRAVKRNRVKRQVREAYRLNKHLLPELENETLVMAFIWIDGQLQPSTKVHQRMTTLLDRLKERL